MKWLLLLLGVMLGLFGYLLGAVPLTGTEPRGQFVDCGAAVFGRPSPLPDPTCGPAYNTLPIPLVSLTYVLILSALALLVAGLFTALHQQASKPSGYAVEDRPSSARADSLRSADSVAS